MYYMGVGGFTSPMGSGTFTENVSYETMFYFPSHLTNVPTNHLLNSVKRCGVG